MHLYQNLVDFIRKTFDEQTEFIPLHDPRFVGNERKYISECLDSNFVSSIGEFIGKFENACAEYTGAKHAVATMNGTSALHLSLQLVGVKRDEEVLTQPVSFIATANAISYIGAHPVFLDIDRDTMGLSPCAVEEFLASNSSINEDGFPYNKKTGKRIAACVPMHTFGHPVKLKDLQEVCFKYNIPLLEDAAESFGSLYNGKYTGTFGKIGTLSFNGNKVITCGGGGMILTDDEEIAKRAKHWTTQAKVPHPWNFVHDHTGYNYRLTNLSAALGCGQIENLNYLLKIKRQLANQYYEFFKDSELEFFVEPENCRSNYWLNTIITKDRTQRDEILDYTNKNGIMTRPLWELLNRLPMFEHCKTDSLKNSIWFADRVVNIPSSAIIPGYRKDIKTTKNFHIQKF